MTTEIRESRRNKDLRRSWQACRVLGGTGARGRKRNIREVVRNDPSVDEWQVAMDKKGGEGGCEAKEIWRREDKELEGYDRKELAQVKGARAGAEAEREWFCQPEELGERLRVMKYRRCVPVNRAPKELYHMA